MPMPDATVAEVAAREALERVFGAARVAHLRPDSVVLGAGSAVGMVPADAIAVADAVADWSARAGGYCRLDASAFRSDAEGDVLVTLADLEAAIAASWMGGDRG